MNDLAHRTTKTTVQAIDKAMTDLVVLKYKLSLNLMEIKDANKVAFLDSPVIFHLTVRPCNRWISEKFHCSTEVITSHASLPTKAVKLGS